MKTKYILYLSAGLFLLSLTQKCYCTTSNCADSIMVFLIGWLGAFSGGAAITWFANPALLFSWITLKSNPKFSMIAAFSACLLAMFFLMFGEITANESGQVQPITEYRLGYWLWLSSTVVMVFGSAWAVRMQRMGKATNEDVSLPA